MIEIEKEATFLRSLARGYNLFAGAGFSVASRGQTGALPVGAAFGDLLRGRFSTDPGRLLQLPMLFTVIERKHPQELYDFVRSTYTVQSWDPRYSALQKLAPSSIITTNVDDLFFQIYATDALHYVNDVYRTGPALSGKSGINLVQVHGSVRDPDRPMVFGPLDIASAASVDPDRWHYIRDQLSARPTLYWGYSFSDAGTLQALRNKTGVRPAIGEAWVQLRPGPESEAYADFYHALDYNIIVAETADLLEYFSSQVVNADSHSAVIPELENIPSLSSVPQRPIEDFFTGAAPAWSDILGGALHRTRYYAELVDRIARKSHTIIAGIPGCGKTTLLMQLAAHTSSDVPKVFHDSLGIAEAEMLARRIGDSSALLILDNVASDIRVVAELLRCPNVILVGADRDFAVNSVYDRIARANVEILGVTSQPREDLVSIWNTIPSRLRRRSMETPKTTWGVDPSLYEFVKTNVRNSFLAERLSQYVREVSTTEPELAELVILACYLNYARSSLSSDLGLAFFRHDDVGYDRLIALISSVGELLKEDPIRDEDLDYFTARSAMAAEEVIFGSPRRIVKDVLVQFFENVSNLRIPRFDVFRRRGYDSKIFVYAFSNLDEGLDLYDFIQEKDGSPYVSQQKALYLANFGRYVEAFAEVEAARNSWRGRRNHTIENTYHKILFLRNVDLAHDDPDARSLCQRALNGLKACFDLDVRKGQHAIIFADCALKYARIASLPSREAESALQTAKGMLIHVMEAESYLDRPRFLRREVEKELVRIS